MSLERLLILYTRRTDSDWSTGKKRQAAFDRTSNVVRSSTTQHIGQIPQREREAGETYDCGVSCDSVLHQQTQKAEEKGKGDAAQQDSRAINCTTESMYVEMSKTMESLHLPLFFFFFAMYAQLICMHVCMNSSLRIRERRSPAPLQRSSTSMMSPFSIQVFSDVKMQLQYSKSNNNNKSMAI